MNIKNKPIKSVIATGSVIFVIVLLGWFVVATAANETRKYTDSWKEIQFAKEHPMLVGAIREKYELGLKALDQMAQEDVKDLGKTVSPIPEPSK